MKNQLFVFIIIIIFSSCGKPVTSGGSSSNEEENEKYTTSENTPEKQPVEPVPLNDSLNILFPVNYAGEGRWTGRDTWGFTMRRKDEKVVFYHETGPGTPFKPLVINAGKIPEELFDHKAESVYKNDQRKLNGYFYFKELPENEIRNFKGRFFYYNPTNNSMREVLEITFSADTKTEVLNILGTIREK